MARIPASGPVSRSAASAASVANAWLTARSVGCAWTRRSPPAPSQANADTGAEQGAYVCAQRTHTLRPGGGTVTEGREELEAAFTAAGLADRLDQDWLRCS